jgi:hypothetical protein
VSALVSLLGRDRALTAGGLAALTLLAWLYERVLRHAAVQGSSVRVLREFAKPL